MSLVKPIVSNGADGFRQINSSDTLDVPAISIGGGAGYYGASAADPVISPSPLDGDFYYNTVIKMFLFYDSNRSKWLSLHIQNISFGDKNATTSGDYYLSINNIDSSASLGYRAPYNGTVIGFSYTRSDSDAANFQVHKNGVSIADIATSAIAGGSNSINADYSQGDVLALYNSGPNATSNASGIILLRWRAWSPFLISPISSLSSSPDLLFLKL